MQRLDLKQVEVSLLSAQTDRAFVTAVISFPLALLSLSLSLPPLSPPSRWTLLLWPGRASTRGWRG